MDQRSVRVVVGQGDRARGSLRDVLTDDGFLVVGEAATVGDLARVLRDAQPDVIVLDDSIGVAAAQLAAELSPRAKLVVIWPAAVMPIAGAARVDPGEVGMALSATVGLVAGLSGLGAIERPEWIDKVRKDPTALREKLASSGAAPVRPSVTELQRRGQRLHPSPGAGRRRSSRSARAAAVAAGDVVAREHRGHRRRGGRSRRGPHDERDGRVGLSAHRHDRPGRSRGRGRPDDRAVLRPESIAGGDHGGSVRPTDQHADGGPATDHHGSDTRRRRTEPRAHDTAIHGRAHDTALHRRWHDDAHQPTDRASTRGRSRRPRGRRWHGRRRHGRRRHGRRRHGRIGSAQCARRGRRLERRAQSARRRARSQGFRVGGTEPAGRPSRPHEQHWWRARSERIPRRRPHAARRPPGAPRAHAQTVTAIRGRRRVR